jgi:transcriptional regulator with XRE-family HTH domain
VLSSHLPTNGFETDLGARVRALRRERGLTLKGLGKRAGLSHPFLSQVERGLARPSVSSVERIAAALEVSVARLWSPARVGEGAELVRSGEGERDEQGLRELEWSSGNRRWPDEFDVQAGGLAIYVARGALEIDLNGTVHELAEGDTLHFDGATPHRLRRTGGTNTRALFVTAE